MQMDSYGCRWMQMYADECKWMQMDTDDADESIFMQIDEDVN